MKKIIILLCVLLLTGCSVDYNLVVTDKGEVRENFTIIVDNELALQRYETIDEFLNYYTEYYPQIKGFENYKIKGKDHGNYSTLKVSSKYNSLKEYTKSKSYISMFSNAVVEVQGKYTTFKSSKNFYLEKLNSDIVMEGEVLYDEFKINIKFYNKVVSHNADIVNEKDNIYTWIVTKNNAKDTIEFKTNSEKRYDVIIKDYIENNIVAISIGGVLLLVVLIGGIIFYIKYRKNQEL